MRSVSRNDGDEYKKPPKRDSETQKVGKKTQKHFGCSQFLKSPASANKCRHTENVRNAALNEFKTKLKTWFLN